MFKDLQTNHLPVTAVDKSTFDIDGCLHYYNNNKNYSIKIVSLAPMEKTKEYVTFQSKKNVKELCIDITREFIVVDGTYHFCFKKGDILKFWGNSESDAPEFKRVSDGKIYDCFLCRLAYRDGPVEKTKRSEWVSDKSETFILEEDGRKATISMRDGKFEKCLWTVPGAGGNLSDWEFFHRVSSKIVSMSK
jgi:hypothetical protein